MCVFIYIYIHIMDFCLNVDLVSIIPRGSSYVVIREVGPNTVTATVLKACIPEL